MNRREAIRQVAWLMGGAVSAPAILGLLNGCTPKPNVAWKPVFLSAEQGALVEEITEIMIPRTDTPGAKDVGIAPFIDQMLKDAYEKEDQDRFRAGLIEFEARAQGEGGKPFLKLAPAQRSALLQTVHDAAVTMQNGHKAQTPFKRPFVLMTKELTLLGFFTSQAGATQVLQYKQVPGEFRPCIRLTEAGNGRTWATEPSVSF